MTERKFWWKARLYAHDNYWHCQFHTPPDLRVVELFQEFYTRLTGKSILLEGMSEQRYEGVGDLSEAFEGLWKERA